jgi:hypothetical protein
MVRRIPPADREKTKVASFRISEGEWFDFSEEADRQNVTATDVIKGAIRNFMAGDFVMPEPIELIPEASTFGVGADIEILVSTAVNTAIGKLSILGIDRVTEIARGEVELALSPLSNDLMNLQAQVTELTVNRDNLDDLTADVADLREQLTQLTTAKAPTTKPSSVHNDGRLEFTKFTQDHGLGIKRGDSASDIKTALEKAGLTDRYQYNSTVRAFYEVGTNGTDPLRTP